ncbi:hypothetical protein [Cupriavidus nantongensis]|uniref:hypothetical protein n=1 Tax=Cupriavidus nantongensis TaxID=1796606 RepID=UPI001237285E|nr:hypothetical protein [Cupriavidus nantongensis]
MVIILSNPSGASPLFLPQPHDGCCSPDYTEENARTTQRDQGRYIVRIGAVGDTAYCAHSGQHKSTSAERWLKPPIAAAKHGIEKDRQQTDHERED